MSLKEQLAQMHQDITAKIPDLAAQFDADTQAAIDKGVGTGGLGVSDTAPDFELPGFQTDSVRFSDAASRLTLINFWTPT